VKAVKVLSDQGSGSWSWSYYALDWLATHDVRPAVASMSLGGSGTQQAMRDAVDAAVNGGVTVVVAGGNSNSDACNFSPAFVPSAITVGSTTSLDERSSFSNYGPCTNIWAPGSSVLSADVGSDTGSSTKSGTSMACPHVSGAAALILAADPTKKAPAVLAELTQMSEKDALTGLRAGDVNHLLSVREPYTGPPTPPPPTPAPPPPGTWELSGAGCQMEYNCIFSNNFPSAYGNNEACIVELFGDIPFRVEAFQTEARYDFLTVGGIAYDGSSGPSAGSYTGAIRWATDGSVTASGWRMCRTDRPDGPTPAPTPAPPPGSWSIDGTGCQEDGNCITSNNYPSNYGNRQECTINLEGSVAITTEAFNTESRYDFLTVGGTRYDGSSGPPSGRYTGTITWSTDGSVTRSGWKLCSR